MTKEEAINVLIRHIGQCGMLMPIEWVQKNGYGSEFMEAMRIAIDALRETQ